MFIYTYIRVYVGNSTFVYNLVFGKLDVDKKTGLPNGIFQTKNPNLGIFWKASQWKTLIHILAIWYILWAFGIFTDHFEYFVVFWYIFSQFWYSVSRNSGSTEKNHFFQAEPVFLAAIFFWHIVISQ
jgi:hypothetical protein